MCLKLDHLLIIKISLFKFFLKYFLRLAWYHCISPYCLGIVSANRLFILLYFVIVFRICFFCLHCLYDEEGPVLGRIFSFAFLSL